MFPQIVIDLREYRGALCSLLETVDDLRETGFDAAVVAHLVGLLRAADRRLEPLTTQLEDQCRPSWTVPTSH
jgi:hypothetical protein